MKNIYNPPLSFAKKNRLCRELGITVKYSQKNELIAQNWRNKEFPVKRVWMDVVLDNGVEKSIYIDFKSGDDWLRELDMLWNPDMQMWHERKNESRWTYGAILFKTHSGYPFRLHGYNKVSKVKIHY